MYRKKLTQKLIERYSQKFIDELKLNQWRIHFHVYKSDAQELKDMSMAKSNRTHNAGISFIGHKSADIILFYDMLANRKDALSTLIHELLHLKLDSLVKLVTIKQDKAYLEEEKIVRCLENLIIGVMKR